MNEEESSFNNQHLASCLVLSSSVSTTPGQLPKKVLPSLKYFVELGTKVDENKPPSNFSSPTMNQRKDTPDINVTAASEPPAKKVKRSYTQGSKVEKLVYVCPECQFWANKLAVFRKHMLLHDSIQTFRCTGCNLVGNFKSNIINHIRRMQEQDDSEHVDGAVCEEFTSNPEESYASCLQTQWVLKHSSSGCIRVAGLTDADSSIDDTPASSSMLMNTLRMSEESDARWTNMEETVLTADHKSQLNRANKFMGAFRVEEKIEDRFQLVPTIKKSDDREEMDQRKLIENLEKEIHDGIIKLREIKNEIQQGRKRIDEKKKDLLHLESKLKLHKTEIMSLKTEKNYLCVRTSDLIKRKTQAALALRTLQKDTLEMESVQVNGQQPTAEQDKILVEEEKSIQRVETELESVEEEMKKLNDCQVAQRMKDAEDKHSLTIQLVECVRMELMELEATWNQPRMKQLREVVEDKIQLHGDAELELARILYVKSKLQVRKKAEEMSCAVERFRTARRNKKSNNNTKSCLTTD